MLPNVSNSTNSTNSMNKPNKPNKLNATFIMEIIKKIITTGYFKIFLAILFNLVLVFSLYYSSKMVEYDKSFKFIYVQIGFLILFLFILFFVVGQLPFSSMIIYVSIGIVLAVLFLTNNTIAGMIFSTYVSTIVFAFIIFIGLAILYNVLMNNLRRIPGWKGFIINVIFLIPCLISEFFEWLFSEFGATPNIVFVLFVLELVLILVYIYLPDIKQQMIKDDGIDLMTNDTRLSNPVLLNQLYFLDKKKILVPNQEDLTNYTTFAFSMWIYVNPVANHYYSYKFETPIFDYNGHPKITYTNDPDSKNADVYKIYFINGTDTDSSNPTTITLLGQRWNFLVFNYTPDGADVFINGVLERSVKFGLNNKNPVYDPVNDTIKIGSNGSNYPKLINTSVTGPDYGLDGGIANVTFYPHILNNSQIANRYNLTMPKPNNLSNYPVFVAKKENIYTPK